MDEEIKSETKKRSSNVFLIVLGLIALLGIAASVFFFTKYQNANKLLTNTGAVSADEAKKITDKISKFYSLPSDETPNVATVLDVTKLTDQPFFAKASNDDKVLIYQKAGIAILYRPSENKIINIAPVSNTSVSETPAVQEIEPIIEPTTSPTVKPTIIPETTPQATP